MVICKEIFTDYKKLYNKALKLINEESKNDPPTEPFRSYYAARDVLLQMQQTLKSSLASLVAEEGDNGGDALTFKVILGTVYRLLARIYHYTGEASVAEQHLQMCIELMEEHRMLPEAIIPYMCALKEMGAVYAIREENAPAYENLIRAEHAYQEFKQAAASDAISIMDIFGTTDEVETGKGDLELENLYTRCIFWLQKVFEMLGEEVETAKYCHLRLRRQLKQKDFKPSCFILDTERLAQNFIKMKMFKEARHHLATAQHIMTSQLSEQQPPKITNMYKPFYADVAYNWVKYGLMLLKTSAERLDIGDDEKRAADAKVKCLNPIDCFLGIDVSAIEERVSADYCLTIDDAKRLYNFIINWLEQAKQYYKSANNMSKYALIIENFGELYENIAFFEKNPLNQAKMNKLSAMYYEHLLKMLNPVTNMATCRKCWLSCGRKYCFIAEKKFVASVQSGGNPTLQETQQVNELTRMAIKSFSEFVKSCREADGLRLKSDLSIEEQCTVLNTYILLGELHYQLFPSDFSEKLKHLETSAKYHKLFIDECAERKEVAARLQPTIADCRIKLDLMAIEIDVLQIRLAK